MNWRKQCAQTRRLLATIVTLGISLFAVFAHAQSLPRTNRDFVVEKFLPEGGVYDVLGVESPRVAPHLHWGVTGYVNESHQIIRLVQQVGNASVSLLSDQLVLDVGATVGLFDFLEVSAMLPVVFWQHGNTAPFIDSTLAKAPETIGLQDGRVVVKAHLVDGNGLHLGVSVPVSAPIGPRDSYLTYHAVTYSPQLLGDYAFGEGKVGQNIRLMANVGFAFRPSRPVVQAHAASALIYGAAAEVPLTERWLMQGDLRGEWGTNEPSGVAQPLELRLAAKWMPVASNWGVLLGAGTGFTKAFGAPLWRVLLGAVWRTSEAPPPDTDGDGVIDEQDICPTTARGDHPDFKPDRLGCPEADSDGDGVYDSTDLCPKLAAGPVPDPNRLGCPDPDNDGDGVSDTKDMCPGVPAGPTPDPNRPGCPDCDADNDGIVDSKDICPNEPAGMQKDPNRLGCPALDRDKDQVPDYQDACPDKPGAPSRDPKLNGCPGLVKMNGSQLVTLKPIQFATGTAQILSASFPVLKGVLDALWTYPDIPLVSIQGHTDNKGNAKKNQDLSLARAQSCRAWLIKNGMAPERLRAEGFGQDRPIADNKTDAGRAQNRRVEFHLVSADQLPGTAAGGAPGAAASPAAPSPSPSSSSSPAPESKAAVPPASPAQDPKTGAAPSPAPKAATPSTAAPAPAAAPH